MKIFPISDMHSEFINWDRTRDPNDYKYNGPADIIIAAGDIGKKGNGPQYLRTVFGQRQIIYVGGNHEYYGSSIQEMDEQLRLECDKYGIHFLQMDVIKIEGIRIAGCTLWSDFELFGLDKKPYAVSEAGRYMNDYRMIWHQDRKKGAISPSDTIRIHQEHLTWLSQQQADIIVTHNCPSFQGVLDIYKDSLLSAAFASDLGHVVSQSGARYWICGHSHIATKFKIGSTEVIMNCQGYPGESIDGFDPDLILQI